MSNSASPEALVNLGAGQRTARRALGYMLLLATVALAVAYIAGDMSPWWLLAVAVLMQNGVLLVLEARHGVCPLNAELGRQNMAGMAPLGREPFRDPSLVPAVKRVARKDVAVSILVAAVTVAVVWGVA